MVRRLRRICRLMSKIWIVIFMPFQVIKCMAQPVLACLWGKESLLDDMMPYQGGGEMISYVTFEATEYAVLPHKFEAGTPNIAGAIGLGAAIDYLMVFGYGSDRCL